MARNVVTIKEVVNDFLLTTGGADYGANVPDYVLHNIALRGCRELGFDMMKRIKSLNLPVDADLATVNLPDDFVDFLRVGYAGGDGVFYTFKENKNINMSMTYATDVFGNYIDSDADGVYDRKDDKTGIIDGPGVNLDHFPYRQYIYDTSKGGKYGYGGARSEAYFRVNYDQNRIEISTEYLLKEVTIEYIADEARSNNPCIHVYCEEALRAYIYYRTIERKADVPYNEKARARSEYFNEARRAKARLNSFSKEEALFTIRKNIRQSPKL
jgi:hypothetical protein